MNWLRLHVSNLCNFKCPNCHVFELGENILPSKVMSQDVFEKAIEVYTYQMQKMGLSRTIVSLYGGETLANKKVIKNVIEKIGSKHNGIELNWVINTNGSLLKEEDVLFFKENNVEIHVRVDGREEIHNISRPTHKGKGTFHMVTPGLEFIKKHQAPAQINSYMMPSNYMHLKDIVDIAQEYQIKKIYLDQFYNLEMISHRVGMEKYREIFFYAMVRGIQINGPWGKVLKNYQNNKNKREKLKSNFCLDVNIDGSCYVPLHSVETKKMNLNLNNLSHFMDNHGWDKVIESVRKANDLSCEGCSIKDYCYGGAIEQVHYHIGDEADTKVSCDFFRDWINFLNRPVYLKKSKKVNFLSVIDLEKASNLIADIEKEIVSLENNLWPIQHPFMVNICEYPEELIASSGQINLPIWAVAATGGNGVLYHKGTKTTPALRHELTHLFLSQANVSAPSWFIEGICEWVQGTICEPEKLYAGLVEQNLFTFLGEPKSSNKILIEVDSNKPGENLFYMQAQSFVSFISDEMGTSQFISAIKNSHETDLIGAVEKTLQVPINALINKFQESKIRQLENDLNI